MASIRERYWRYSLVALILGMGVTVFVELIPFLGGLLGAATIYVLLRGQMVRLTEHRHWRRSAAAWLLLGEAVLCFLIPISGIVWLVVGKVQDVTLDPQSLVASVRHVAGVIRIHTGYDLWQESNLRELLGYLPKVGQQLVEAIGSFAVNVVVLLFVLYFLLVGGCRMEAYVREMLPFSRSEGSDVLREIHRIVRSNAIVIPLLAVAQGFVAWVGYVIFGVHGTLIWGVLTGFATVIPIVGTALVWVPLALYMGLAGQWGEAVGLLLYGVLVVTQVDNILRMVLQKKLDNTHPLVTIFGVIIGLSLFGFIGLIFGPLLLAMLVFCVDLFKRKYLDVAPGRELFDPDGAPER